MSAGIHFDLQSRCEVYYESNQAAEQYNLMQAIQRKLEAEKAQVELEKSEEREKSIARLLDNQHVQLIMGYISMKLDSLSFSEISSYSAGEISKLIFEPQLKLIENEFKELPDELCSLQEFVIIMLRVLKFDIDVCPQAAIGLREIFSTIAAGMRLIDYHSLFKYIVGQVVSAKQQVSNTEFQMRFHENKLQDFLFHDKGIKRVFYSKELKIAICLDRVSNQLKFYDKDMKLTARFLPNKDKHDGRVPELVDMGFCEIYSRVGIVMDDSTLSVINIKPLLSPDLDATASYTNELTIKCPHLMKAVYFLQMWSKWISVSQDDQVFKYDFDKQRHEEKCEQLNLGITDLQVSDIIELTVLNMVSVISGNQVIFFNENLSQKHFVFSHGCNIRTFRFSEQENKFYLAGKENIITVFERDKLLNDFKIRTLELGKFKVNSFEVFPQMNVILLIDDDCNVRLLDYNRKVINQQQNFKQIKKNQQELMLCKFNKHEFCLFETYILVLSIEKVAIESEAQTRFSPYFYYNPNRELFYCSANNQVVSVHLLRGQVEDAYTEDNSNVGRHLCFFLGNKTHVFEISDGGYLFDLYFNDQKLEGENRNYKRKINLQKILGALYDDDTRVVMAWSDTKVIQIKNEGFNNFSILNSIQFINGEKIRDVQLNSGLITVFCTSTVIHDFNCYSTSLMGSRMFRPTNLHLQASEEDAEILQYVRLDAQKLELLLCTNNTIFLIGQGKVGCMKIQDLLPKSKVTYNFTKVKFQKITRRTRKPDASPGALEDEDHQLYMEDIVKTLFIFDSSGYLVSLDISQILKQFDSDSRFELIQLINEAGRLGFTKGGTVLDTTIKPTVRTITKSTISDIGKPKSIKIWKAHEKEVIQIVGVNFEQSCMISFANDGFLKLWNQKCQLLFALKMPSFNREIWNMEEIEKLKCAKNVQKMQRLVKQYERRLKKSKDNQSPQHLIQKTKNFKNNNLFDKANINDPFVLEIDNREVEDFMNKTQMPPRRFSLQQKKSKRHISSSAQKSPELSPWKKNHKFLQLMEAVDRKHRSDKIPVQLTKLRGSLDVRNTTSESPEKTMRVSFLPQLQHYAPQPKLIEETQTAPSVDLYGQVEDGLETCMYLRNRRIGPRINKFDQIDKQFERKRMQQFKNTKKNAVIKVTKKQQLRPQREYRKEIKGELLENIKKIFEDHNKEVLRTKIGRLREIPRVQIRKPDDTY